MLVWDFVALALNCTCTSVSGNSLGIVWMGSSGKQKAVYIFLDISVKTELHKWIHQQECPVGIYKWFRGAVFMCGGVRALIQWKPRCAGAVRGWRTEIRPSVPWGAMFVTSICTEAAFATLLLKNCKGTVPLGPKDENLDVSPHSKDHFISSRWTKP